MTRQRRTFTPEFKLQMVKLYLHSASMKTNLNEGNMFHTDRGKEFDNKLISEALETFSIQRSLSMKGCP